MASVLGFLNGKKTYVLVLAYVLLQLWNGGGLDALAPDQNLGQITLAAAIAALRAGVTKSGPAS